ncbi:MAG: hypothetical protein KGN36_04960 [Acidobacteriota bacterium]|nr:hypothetical protein [Acidobacteriota bacterium]
MIFGRTQLQIAKLFVDGNETPHLDAKSLVLRNLVPSVLDGWPGMRAQ